MSEIIKNQPKVEMTNVDTISHDIIKDLRAQLAEAQKEAFPAYKREKALRCKAEFELAEARKENEELKAHAYAVAKDLRKRMNEQDALWQETAQHLLERAEKAEAELAELREQNKVLREEENVPYLRELKENAALRERLKKVEEAKEYKDHEFCKDVECVALEYSSCNAYVCHKTAKHFHRWLEQNGYTISKAIKAACEGK